MLTRYTQDDLLYAAAFDRVEPLFDPWVAAARGWAIMLNLWGKKKRPVEIHELLPWLKKKQQTPEQIKSFLEGLLKKPVPPTT